MSESEYRQYWTARVFRGEAQAEPLAVFSNGRQEAAIEVLPGAIALVDAADLKSGMMVIKVEGHLPGEENYPLH